LRSFPSVWQARCCPARSRGVRRAAKAAPRRLARGRGRRDFILDILAEKSARLSVQEIVEHLDEAQLELKRQTLVVRLHRMVRAGKLARAPMVTTP